MGEAADGGPARSDLHRRASALPLIGAVHASHAAALFRTPSAGLRAPLTVIRLVLRALRPAGLAHVRAQRAELRREIASA